MIKRLYYLIAFGLTCTLLVSQATAQVSVRQITGKVISEDDRLGMPGVNVVVKGSSLGTTTDAEGSFTLEVPGDESVLVFSFIGYKPAEELVGLRTSINVTLVLDTQTLEEVVVTAIGIESNKRQLAYSVKNVNTDQVLEAHETNLISALGAKIAGVQVTSSSGVPGASANIRVRGNKSFKGRNSPLFVIDGIPVDNSSSGNDASGVDISNRVIDINSSDIESMTVLSGPSATSLYGIRATNGAVIITTKRGKKGAPVIKISSGYSVDEVNKLPARQTKYAQGAPTGGVFSYLAPGTTSSSNINSWGPLISELEFGGETDYPYDKNGTLVPIGTGNGAPAKVYDPYNTFFVKGHTSDNNVSVSGGSDFLSYMCSFGRLYQSGIVPNADFERTSFRSNVDIHISPKFSIATSLAYTNSGGNRMLRGSQVSGVMTGILRNPPTFDIGNGKSGEDAANDPNTYLLEDGEQRTFAIASTAGNTTNARYDNPFFTINHNPFKDNVNRVIGNVGLSYQLMSWLRLQIKIGLDHYTDRRNSAIDVNSASQSIGSIFQSVRTNSDLNSDFLVLANKKLNENMEIAGTLGHNFYSSNFVLQSASADSLAIPGFFNIKNAKDVRSSEDISRKKLFGLYGEVKFIYKGFFIVNLSGRNDWSSTLPKNNNSFFYPSAALGLVVTDMVQLQSDRLLSYAKLRASYGQTGNDAPLYATDLYYTPAVVDGDDIIAGNSFPVFDAVSYERSGLLWNQNLKPELATTLELGSDLKLLSGRLSIDFTWYKSVINDQVVNVTISAPSGFTQYVTNAGQMRNTGVELVLSGNPIETSSFTWNVSLNFSRNRNKVTDVPGGVEDLTIASFSAVSSKIIEGQPYGILSGTKYSRNEGGRLIIGNDGWPKIDTQQGIVGDPNPDWTAGINNMVSFKGLSLSFLWDFRKGGDIWNGTKGFMNYLGVSKETGDQREIRNFVFDGVTEDGSENTTPVDFANPLNGLTGIRWRRSGSLGVAEDAIEDGSWVRLRSVTVSYTLPKSKLPKLIGSATISLYARNLLLFTRYSGIDPETNLRGDSNDMGWDYFNHPNTKTMGASLNLTIK